LRYKSVQSSAQRPLSILPSRELTPPVPSLCIRKNILFLIIALKIFNFGYDNIWIDTKQEKYNKKKKNIIRPANILFDVYQKTDKYIIRKTS